MIKALLLFSSIFILIIPTFGLEILNSKKFEAPTRELSVIAAPEGYYPAKIVGYVGEKLTVFLTSITNEPNCLLLPEFNLNVGSRAKKIGEATTLLEKAGRFPFYCPSTGIRGELVVLNHPEKLKEISRATASTVKIWTPSDE